MTEPAISPIVLLAGVPASGKSWVAQRAKDDYHHLAHDDYQEPGFSYGHQIQSYLAAIVLAATNATKPVLAETPFSVSRLAGPLELLGFRVIIVYVVAHEEILAARHAERGKPFPLSYGTQQDTYIDRALASGDFHGTSDETLAHLLQLAKDLANA